MFLENSGHGEPLSGCATPHIELVCFSQPMMSKGKFFQAHSCETGFDIQVIAHYEYRSPPVFVVHVYSKGKIAPGTGAKRCFEALERRYPPAIGGSKG